MTTADDMWNHIADRVERRHALILHAVDDGAFFVVIGPTGAFPYDIDAAKLSPSDALEHIRAVLAGEKPWPEQMPRTLPIEPGGDR